MAHYVAAGNCSHPGQNFNYALLKNTHWIKDVTKGHSLQSGRLIRIHMEDESLVLNMGG